MLHSSVARGIQLGVATYRTAPRFVRIVGQHARGRSTLEDDLERLAGKRKASIHLHDLIDTALGNRLPYRPPSRTELQQGVLQQIACCVHREIRVRLAKRLTLVEASFEPHKDSNFLAVSSASRSSFDALREVEVPNTPAKEEAFATAIRSVYERQTVAPKILAEGLVALQRDTKAVSGRHDLDRFVESFLHCYVGNRTLIGQYLALRDQWRSSDSQQPSDQMLGLIQLDMDPAKIAREVKDEVMKASEQRFGVSPPIELHCPVGFTLPFVVGHFRTTLLEAVKEAVVATVRHHGVDCSALPPVCIDLRHGALGPSVKIKDWGGGTSRNDLDSIAVAVTREVYEKSMAELLEAFQGSPNYRAVVPYLVSTGLPLSIAKAHLRSLGSFDLFACSTEYGTDVDLNLSEGPHR